MGKGNEKNRNTEFCLHCKNFNEVKLRVTLAVESTAVQRLKREQATFVYENI